MGKIRVLVVEDSLTIRKRLIEVLGQDAGIEVVGEAEDGKTAIDLCMSLRPDVVSLDMMLPIMTGLAATEYIMAHRPTPILIVSASTNRGEVFKTYDALRAGAIDVLEKPTGNEADGTWERQYVDTIKLVSRIKVITHIRGKFTPMPVTKTADPSAPTGDRPAGRIDIITIGTSTGGPGALVEVFRHLPKDFRIPIVAVIHIGRPFAAPFAEWLSNQSALPVAYAKDRQRFADLGPGVILAPPDQHLIISKGVLRLTNDPERHSCRPAVDCLFESIAAEFGDRAAAALLTGMGRDGAEGLLAIRRAGGITIAQDEGSSVVYGMPREAVIIGAAQRTLPLQAVGPALAVLAIRGER